MKINFSADEVFKIAEQMERNGYKFYNKAAEKSASRNDTREQLQRLANMEKEHEKVFATIRKKITEGQESSFFDPDDHGALYLQAWADGQVFDETGELAETIIDNKDVREILLTAIGLEKDSILFYIGMKEMTIEEDTRKEIDNIIKEEMKHIVQLNKELESVKK